MKKSEYPAKNTDTIFFDFLESKINEHCDFDYYKDDGVIIDIFKTAYKVLKTRYTLAPQKVLLRLVEHLLDVMFLDLISSDSSELSKNIAELVEKKLNSFKYESNKSD